ncbi:hypothetical protein GCM10008995_20850 [Halobellus salinus]|uniref:Uncharacterized protein n=1 Tax=Halobellus salinus TaxID=931585 RepID=A0A830EPD6_9EURY|nr:hypothetical protein [Halobellus salinus]GGJ10797.1 hypothetical protein GCM10008995_20850 [Halobellus salinus]SMP10487.1 hypothetical protein SAMN06265347_103183 [Halobellus salinus]
MIGLQAVFPIEPDKLDDAAAMEAHVEFDHFGEFEAALPEPLTGTPDIVRFDVDSVSDVGP